MKYENHLFKNIKQTAFFHYSISFFYLKPNLKRILYNSRNYVKEHICIVGL